MPSKVFDTFCLPQCASLAWLEDPHEFRSKHTIPMFFLEKEGNMISPASHVLNEMPKALFFSVPQSQIRAIASLDCSSTQSTREWNEAFDLDKWMRVASTSEAKRFVVHGVFLMFFVCMSSKMAPGQFFQCFSLIPVWS